MQALSSLSSINIRAPVPDSSVKRGRSESSALEYFTTSRILRRRNRLAIAWTINIQHSRRGKRINYLETLSGVFSKREAADALPVRRILPGPRGRTGRRVFFFFRTRSYWSRETSGGSLKARHIIRAGYLLVTLQPPVQHPASFAVVCANFTTVPARTVRLSFLRLRSIVYVVNTPGQKNTRQHLKFYPNLFLILFSFYFFFSSTDSFT
ncbi:hypothetical protein PUN28_005822 [Cardiocondyla obscurior]|uniref:Uncharacterized protein n=1 Tax=Cardiocondyla obscurior TaxID=286306 RepID=A0AAW2G5X0_9HYME